MNNYLSPEQRAEAAYAEWLADDHTTGCRSHFTRAIRAHGEAEYARGEAEQGKRYISYITDKDAEIDPPPMVAGGHKPESELDRLSNILKSFNEQFGTMFTDTDRIAMRIRNEIAPKVADDAAYQNAKQNTPHTARLAHDQALGKVMQLLLKDDTQVYKQFVENESFRRFVADMVYGITN